MFKLGVCVGVRVCIRMYVCACICACVHAYVRACVREMFWTERSGSLRAAIVHLVKTRSRTELFIVALFGSYSILVTAFCPPRGGNETFAEEFPHFLSRYRKLFLCLAHHS